MEPNCEIKLEDKKDYYKDSRFISFSGLKVFSRCETLYRDIFVTKVYEEPEQDYFIYGKLVDAMVTESPDFIEKNFIKVERRVNPEDALRYENEIKNLQKEIDEKKLQIQDKPNKTTEKGIESRLKKVAEVQLLLDGIKHLADKQQVTPAVWKNAEDTALAIKAHPYYSNMEFNEVTSQQIFTCNIDGIPCKGKLDHLKLSPALTKVYAIYVAGQMSFDDLRKFIAEKVHRDDMWAIITDVKTCYSLEKIEPYNPHYRGQLGFYQDLVHHTLGIPIENIKCQILVADKVTNLFKKAELFIYTQQSINEIKDDVRQWKKFWDNAYRTNTYISAKWKHGMKQSCFTCTECRFCPFSRKPGDAVVISGPRFGNDNERSDIQPINMEDVISEY